MLIRTNKGDKITVACDVTSSNLVCTKLTGVTSHTTVIFTFFAYTSSKIVLAYL